MALLPTSNHDINHCLHPFVYWGQTSDSITLAIDLKNVQVFI